MKKIIVSWSGGKDSAYMLNELLESEEYFVEGLLSTTSAESERLPMHEVKRGLIHAQAEAFNLPLFEVQLPARADNDTYEKALSATFDTFKKAGITGIAHADLYLEDIREYRENNLRKAGMTGLFPIWKRETRKVAEDFINKGFKAIITTVDTEKLSSGLVGRIFDHGFLEELPASVDPCGENGEFHTFVFDGPMFRSPVNFETGGTFATMEGRFVHCELLQK